MEQFKGLIRWKFINKIKNISSLLRILLTRLEINNIGCIYIETFTIRVLNKSRDEMRNKIVTKKFVYIYSKI